jgi:hypothetical protein
MFSTSIASQYTSNALLQTVDIAFIAENFFFGLEASLNKV